MHQTGRHKRVVLHAPFDYPDLPQEFLIPVCRSPDLVGYEKYRLAARSRRPLS
jgi:hypothetical protein